MSFDIFIGYKGKMSLQLQEIYQEKNKSFKLFGPDAPADVGVKNFEGASGVIDFSSPSATAEITKLAAQAKTPLVCGTTGWKSSEERNKIFAEASKEIAIVADSNFSLGVEILCQATEKLAKGLDHPFIITDIHHKHKVDTPSGTALKIKERILSVRPSAKVEFLDMRIGEVPGEHSVTVAWDQELLEFTHRANSRRAFADGAIKALEWATKQKPGLYSMKDVFNGI
jgi:4-hydroxy-tetrahydrodipicolinate reductase